VGESDIPPAPEAAVPIPVARKPDLSQLVAAARHVLRVDALDERRLFTDLFNHDHFGATSGANGAVASMPDLCDESYYVVYRYDTQPDRVVKTLLVISTPKQNEVDYFSFRNIYRESDGTDHEDPNYRNSAGAIFSFDNAFFGVGGSAHFDPRIGPENRRNRGLKLFAIPHVSFRRRSGLLSGLYVSSDQDWSPITGRFAMVHLGFRSSLPVVPDHDSVGIGIIPSSDALAADLASVLRDRGGRYRDTAVAFVSSNTINTPLNAQERDFERIGRQALRAV
jgi:hypothetical protein